MKKLLEVRHLRVSFQTYGADVQAVRGVTFELDEGETLAIVGESGSGKVLLPNHYAVIPMPPGKITGGQIFFEARNI